MIHPTVSGAATNRPLPLRFDPIAAGCFRGSAQAHSPRFPAGAGWWTRFFQTYDFGIGPPTRLLKVRQGQSAAIDCQSPFPSHRRLPQPPRAGTSAVAAVPLSRREFRSTAAMPPGIHGRSAAVPSGLRPNPAVRPDRMFGGSVPEVWVARPGDGNLRRRAWRTGIDIDRFRWPDCTTEAGPGQHRCRQLKCR